MRGFLGLLRLDGGAADQGLFGELQRAFAPELTLPIPHYSAFEGRLMISHAGLAAPSPKTQHAHSADGKLILFLDGEVYNEDLTASDQAQALVEAFSAEGDRLLVRLNGSFALLLIEPFHYRVSLVCDRSGSQPLFYLGTPPYFIFSSRLKPIAALPGWIRHVDAGALADMLTCGFILRGASLLQGVKQLGPGQILTMESGNLKIRHYWSFTLTSDRKVGDDSAYSEELGRLVQQAVGRQIRDSVPYGVLLSGGYDSRAIAGCVKKAQSHNPLRTITWGENDSRPESDAFIARQIAQHIRSDHTFYALNGSALPSHFRSFVLLDEGRTDAVGNYPESLGIFARIRQELGIHFVLRGDECFGWKEDVKRESDMLHSLAIHELSKLEHTYDYLRPKYRRLLESVNRAQREQLLADCPYPDLHERKDYLYFTQRLFGYLNPLTQLKQIELNLRNPFLDNDLLDFISLLPTSLRLGKALFKKTVEQMFPDLGAYGFARYSSLIDWDRQIGVDQTLQDYIRQILLEQHNGFDEILDYRKLESFLGDAFAAAAASSFTSPPRPLHAWQRMHRRIIRRQGYFDLSPITQISRLMILKIWVDEYMNGDFELSL
jgi:asparagine synthetase B (glutamine-hydrolysing)